MQILTISALVAGGDSQGETRCVAPGNANLPQTAKFYIKLAVVTTKFHANLAVWALSSIFAEAYLGATFTLVFQNNFWDFV